VSGSRVAEVPTDQSTNSGGGSEDDLRSIVKALSGLIQILNSTSKGRKRNTIRGAPHRIGGGHLGNKPYPVKNIIFDDAATFSKIKSHNLPSGETIYFNVKRPLATGLSQGLIPSSTAPRTTIPPHLIPLGPDGAPLVRPDGTFVDPGRAGPGGKDSQLSQMFPYLRDRPNSVVSLVTQQPRSSSPTTPWSLPDATTAAPGLETGFLWDLAGYGITPGGKKEKKVEKAVEGQEDDHLDMFSRAIETMRDMPMETKRHMLASMMFTVPMAAVTMAAAGLPHLAIAPLATVIPGFMFAAFTDVNAPHDPGSHGHHALGQAHNHPAPDATTPVDTNPVAQPSRQTGLAGLLQTIRNFSTNRRQNQTLHIRTDGGGHQHG
jgi:hypothetical protein